MSPIESTGRSHPAAPFSRVEEQAFDPAAVLLALSAQQFGIMQTTLANQITGARSQVGRIADMGSAAVELTRLRDNVIASETASVEETLKLAQSYSAKYAGGEGSTLTVSEADNDRLKQLAAWGDERGFSLPEMTKLEQPSEEAIKAAEEQGVDPPEARLVLDETAVRATINSLKTYLADVQLGVADNPAIRQLMGNSAGATTLLGKVREYGYEGDVDSLADLEAAAQSLERTALEQIALLSASTDAVQQLAEQISGKSENFATLIKDQDLEPRRLDEANRLQTELQRAQLQRNLRELLEEQAAALSSAEALGLSVTLSHEAVSGLISNLTEAEQARMSSDFAKWTSEFNASHSADNNRSTHNSLADMRRDYL